MTITIDVLASLEEADAAEYRAFHRRSGASVFYDWHFLMAVERSPLLRVRRVFYIAVRDAGRLAAFVPAYVQDITTVDPLGVLAAAAGLRNAGADRGLFSHVMHCTDSTIPVAPPVQAAVYDAVFDTLHTLARASGARYVGLLNIPDGPVLREAQRLGLNIRFMVDRHYVEVGQYRDFAQFVQALPPGGRHEMTRQLRKLAANEATVQILAPPFDDRLEQLARLCERTTARHGTPGYFPAEPLARLCRLGGDLVRLILVERAGRLAGGFVCLQAPGVFHVWSAGMDYDDTGFSPYTAGMAAAYQYAMEAQRARVEGGRLNARIKARLGLHPLRLYAILSEDLDPPATAGAAQPVDARAAFARALAGEARFADHPAFPDWRRCATWNGRDFPREPAGIVRAACEDDVVRTIEFARAQGLRISVRGGGHGYAGSVLRQGAIMLDLSALRALDVVPGEARAIAQPGVTSQQLSETLAAHRLAFPTGHGRGVAISGFLLGGGVGINSAQWGGMSVRNVEAMDVVTADGQCRHVDARHDPSLFWAARGGGPELFCAVTRFYLKCWPLPPAIASSDYLTPLDTLPPLLDQIARHPPPPSLQVMLAVIPAEGGGRAVLLNTLAFAESHAQAIAQRTAFVAGLGVTLTPVAEDEAASFASIFDKTDAMLRSSRYRTDNILTDDGPRAATILCRQLARQPSPATVPLFIWRGRQTYPDALCAAQGAYFVSTYAQWNAVRDDEANRRWLAALYDELAGVACGAYINEFDLEQRAGEIDRCFAPEAWQTFRRLRRQYDPHGFFTVASSLAPGQYR